MASNRIKQMRNQRNLSLQALADLVGTSKSQIDKLEREERRLTVDWMIRIAKALNVPAADLLPLEEQTTTGEENDGRGDKSGNILDGSETALLDSLPAGENGGGVLFNDVPVLGAARGGDDGFFFDNGMVHEYVRRPANLSGVSNAFAVYTVGESMQPRFFPGEILFVNPNKPVTRGCFVVCELRDGQGLVKQYIHGDDNTIMLSQFNPPKRIRLARNDIKNTYRIVTFSEAG